MMLTILSGTHSTRSVLTTGQFGPLIDVSLLRLAPRGLSAANYILENSCVGANHQTETANRTWMTPKTFISLLLPSPMLISLSFYIQKKSVLK